jgi:hypothetical protein
MTKTLTALAAAAAIAVTAVATPTPADARGRGGAVAAGIIGGLAAGAIIGSAFARPYGYYGYYGYAPGPYYVYGPRCFWTRERFWDGYGWRLRRVRVCD